MFYIGLGKPIERQILGTSIKQYKIQAGKLRRYHDEGWWQRLLDIKTNLLNLFDGFRLIIGICRSWWLLGRIKPDVVFIKGGYVGLPVGIAARLRKHPIVIHESDVRPGLTNLWLAKYASLIATGFPLEHYPQWRGKNTRFTGNPVRHSVLMAPSQTSAKRKLGYSRTDKVVLIAGGSSGAQVLNQAVTAQLEKLTKHFRIIHITGKADYAQLKELPKLMHLGDAYTVYEFAASNLPTLLSAADCIVSRAGTNMIAEAAALGKPLILVPAPQLSDQTKNAQVLVQHQAAWMLKQDDLRGLPQLLAKLMASTKLQAQLGENLHRNHKQDAADTLAQALLELG